ncbi:CRE-SRD-50 protein [Caenorhabditis remanei]|uniref:CRE-SRD-50 protein n=1 Tax=Caenorhabditis remanei TaxID=31234 RepID=E3MDY0_CAERE|nr:CRE-SRD-50 protein [Caenorhabditis remanei]
MMSDMENRLVLILTIFYNLYFLLAITSQILLLFLMIKCRVRSLKDMKIYLFNTLVLQFISTISAYLLQCRAVPSSDTMALLCYGPCKYFGTIPCKVIFQILETSLIACATSLIIAFYYRYEMLTTNSFTRNRHYKQLVISYGIPLVFLIFEVLSPSDLSKVAAELMALHPTYDIDSYTVLGFSEVKSVIATIQTLLMMLGIYGTPFIALLFRSKIMKILNKTSKSYHAEKIEQTKSMIQVGCNLFLLVLPHRKPFLFQGLTLQTLLPLFCYVPSFTYYIYAQYTHSDSLVAEFAVSPFGFIYTIFDPLLTIYYVLPYRRTFNAIFRKHSVSNVTFIQSETTRRVI